MDLRCLSSQPYRNRKQNGGSQGLRGVGGRGKCSKGVEFQIWKMKKFWGISFTTVRAYLTLLNSALQMYILCSMFCFAFLTIIQIFYDKKKKEKITEQNWGHSSGEVGRTPTPALVVMGELRPCLPSLPGPLSSLAASGGGEGICTQIAHCRVDWDIWSSAQLPRRHPCWPPPPA